MGTLPNCTILRPVWLRAATFAVIFTASTRLPAEIAAALRIPQPDI